MPERQDRSAWHGMHMKQLSQSDMSSISVFLKELYTETRFDRLPQVMLDGVMRLIPSEVGGYNEIDSRTNATLFELRPAMPELLELTPMLEAFLPEHPVLNHYRAQRDRTPCQITDFLSRRQFRQTGLYNAFYRRVGIDNQMACVLSEAGATNDIGIALNRRHRDFAERDRAVLEFLRPHLIQARHNALAFTGAERQLEALRATTEEVCLGIVTLDRAGRIVSATPKALCFLNSYFPGPVRDPKRLPESLADWVRRCRTQLADGWAGDKALGEFTIRAGGGRLSIRYSPTVSGVDRLVLREESALAYQQRARSLGLTPREAEVMSWIVEGKTNPEIAAILGASPRTIHKHAEHIFAKLNVSTRNAAVREILSRPAGPSPNISYPD